MEQVSEEAVALRLDLDRHTHRERRRAAEEADRADLLEGRAGAAAWAAAADADAAAEGAIRNSKRILEETFATGAAVLGAMAGQREVLKVRRGRGGTEEGPTATGRKQTRALPSSLLSLPLHSHSPPSGKPWTSCMA